MSQNNGPISRLVNQGISDATKPKKAAPPRMAPTAADYLLGRAQVPQPPAQASNPIANQQRQNAQAVRRMSPGIDRVANPSNERRVQIRANTPGTPENTRELVRRQVATLPIPDEKRAEVEALVDSALFIRTTYIDPETGMRRRVSPLASQNAIRQTGLLDPSDAMEVVELLKTEGGVRLLQTEVKQFQDQRTRGSQQAKELETLARPGNVDPNIAGIGAVIDAATMSPIGRAASDVIQNDPANIAGLLGVGEAVVGSLQDVGLAPFRAAVQPLRMLGVGPDAIERGIRQFGQSAVRGFAGGVSSMTRIPQLLGSKEWADLSDAIDKGIAMREADKPLDKTFFNEIGQAVGGMIPQIIPAILTGGATAGASAAGRIAASAALATTEALANAAGGFDRAVKEGQNIEEARQRAARAVPIDFFASVVLNRIGRFGEVSPAWKKEFLSALTEGFQEQVQTGLEGYVATGKADFTSPEAIKGFVIGAALSPFMGAGFNLATGPQMEGGAEVVPQRSAAASVPPVAPVTDAEPQINPGVFSQFLAMNTPQGAMPDFPQDRTQFAPRGRTRLTIEESVAQMSPEDKAAFERYRELTLRDRQRGPQSTPLSSKEQEEYAALDERFGGIVRDQVTLENWRDKYITRGRDIDVLRNAIRFSPDVARNVLAFIESEQQASGKWAVPEASRVAWDIASNEKYPEDLRVRAQALYDYFTAPGAPDAPDVPETAPAGMPQPAQAQQEAQSPTQPVAQAETPTAKEIGFNDIVVVSSPDGGLQRVGNVRGVANGNVTVWMGDNQITVPANQVRLASEQEATYSLGTRIDKSVQSKIAPVQETSSKQPAATPAPAITRTVEEGPDNSLRTRGFDPFNTLPLHQITRAELQQNEGDTGGAKVPKSKPVLTLEAKWREAQRKVDDFVQSQILSGNRNYANNALYLKLEDASESAGRAYRLKREAEIDAAHYRAVEQALQRGLPVPPEVLADYPDLAAKYQPQPVAQTPANVPDAPSLRKVAEGVARPAQAETPKATVQETSAPSATQGGQVLPVNAIAIMVAKGDEWGALANIKRHIEAFTGVDSRDPLVNLLASQVLREFSQFPSTTPVANRLSEAVLADLRRMVEAFPDAKDREPGTPAYEALSGNPAFRGMSVDDLKDALAKRRQQEGARKNQEQQAAVASQARSLASYAPDLPPQYVKDIASRVANGEVTREEAVATLRQAQSEEKARIEERRFDEGVANNKPAAWTRGINKKQTRLSEDGRFWTDTHVLIAIPKGAKLPASMAPTNDPMPDEQIARVWNGNSTAADAPVLTRLGQVPGEADVYDIAGESIAIDRNRVALVEKMHGPLTLRGHSPRKAITAYNAKGNKVAVIMPMSVDDSYLQMARAKHQPAPQAAQPQESARPQPATTPKPELAPDTAQEATKKANADLRRKVQSSQEPSQQDVNALQREYASKGYAITRNDKGQYIITKTKGGYTSAGPGRARFGLLRMYSFDAVRDVDAVIAQFESYETSAKADEALVEYAKDKQPHELTYAEIEQFSKVSHLGEALEKAMLERYFYSLPAEQRRAVMNSDEWPSQYSHRMAVEEAYGSGMDVPANVLEELGMTGAPRSAYKRTNTPSPVVAPKPAPKIAEPTPQPKPITVQPGVFPLSNARPVQKRDHIIALYPNRVGGKFSPSDIEAVKEWAQSEQATVVASPTVITVTGPLGKNWAATAMKAVESVRGLTVRQARNKAAVDQYNQRVEAKNAADKAYIAANPDVAKWLASVFGDNFANPHNQAALIRYLVGDAKKFDGGMNPSWVPGLEKLGLNSSNASNLKTNDIAAVIKQAWQAQQAKQANPQSPAEPKVVGDAVKYERMPDWELLKAVKDGDARAKAEALKRTEARGMRSPVQWQRTVEEERDAQVAAQFQELVATTPGTKIEKNNFTDTVVSAVKGEKGSWIITVSRDEGDKDPFDVTHHTLLTASPPNRVVAPNGDVWLEKSRRISALQGAEYIVAAMTEEGREASEARAQQAKPQSPAEPKVVGEEPWKPVAGGKATYQGRTVIVFNTETVPSGKVGIWDGRRKVVNASALSQPKEEVFTRIPLEDIQDPLIREWEAYKREFPLQVREQLEPLIAEEAEFLAKAQYGLGLGSHFEGDEYVKGLEPGMAAYSDVFQQARRRVVKRFKDGGYPEISQAQQANPQSPDILASPSKPAKSNDTITVDGKERPRTNSNGQPIHPTEEGIRAFWKWFGDSKVVDEQGRPLVVYKGMTPYKDLPIRDSRGNIKASGNPTEIDVIQRPERFPSFDKDEGLSIAGFFGDAETASRFAQIYQGGVYPVYLKIETPYVDSTGRKAGVIQFEASGRPFREAMRSGRYDGAIMAKTPDEGTIYIALDPTQIKSATGNQGTFSPDNPSILASPRRVRRGMASEPTAKPDAPVPQLTPAAPKSTPDPRAEARKEAKSGGHIPKIEGWSAPEPKTPAGDLNTIRMALDRVFPRHTYGRNRAGTKGTFNLRTGFTMVGYVSDSVTRVHELAHQIEKVYGLMDGLDADTLSLIDAELAGDAFGQTVPDKASESVERSERFAEWLTAYIEEPVGAAMLAPTVLKVMVQRVPAQARAAIDEFSSQVQGYRNLPPEKQMALRIEDPSARKTFVDTLRSWFAQAFQAIGADGAAPDMAVHRTRVVDGVWRAAVTNTRAPIEGAVLRLAELQGFKIEGNAVIGMSADPDNDLLNSPLHYIAAYPYLVEMTKTMLEGGLKNLRNETYTYNGQPLSVVNLLNTLTPGDGRAEQLKSAYAYMFAQRFESLKGRWTAEEQAALETRQAAREAKAKSDRARKERRLITEMNLALSQMQASGKSIRQIAAERVKREAEIAKELDALDAKNAKKLASDLKKDYARTREVLRQRFENMGLTPGETLEQIEAAQKAIMDDFNARPAEWQKQVKDFAAQYRMLGDASLDVLVSGGLMNQREADEVRRNNPYWISARRVQTSAVPKLTDADQTSLSDSGASQFFQKTALTGADDGINQFKGSQASIQDPVVSLMQNIFEAYRAAYINKSVGGLVALAEGAGPGAGMFDDITNTTKADSTVANLAPGETVRVYRQVPVKDKKGKPVLDEAGEPVMQTKEFRYIVLDPAMQRAFKGVSRQFGVPDIPAINVALRVLALPKRLLQWGVVVTPMFKIFNVIRDTAERVVGGRHDRSLAKVFTTRPLNEYEYRSMGIGIERGGILGDRNDYQNMMTSVMRNLNPRNTMLVKAGAPFRAFHNMYFGKFSVWSESVNRTITYNAALKKAKERGMSDSVAALWAAGEARSAGTDFARHGALTAFFDTFIPFLNPAVQGQATFWTNAAKNPKRFMARLIMYALIGAGLEELWALKDGTSAARRDLPPYMRYMFWNFHIKDDKWLRIPKGHELGAILALGEEARRGAAGEEMNIPGVGRSMFQTMSPVSDSDIYGPLTTLIQWNANRDFFTGNTIVPEYESKRAMELRDFENSSPMAKLLARITNKDARLWDMAINETFGTVGAIATDASRLAGPDELPMSDRLAGLGGRVFGVVSRQSHTQAPAVVEVRSIMDRIGSQDVMRPYRDAYHASTSASERERVGRLMIEEAERILPRLRRITSRVPRNEAQLKALREQVSVVREEVKSVAKIRFGAPAR